MQLRESGSLLICGCIDLQSASSKDTILHSLFCASLHITIVTREWFDYGADFEHDAQFGEL